MAMTYRELVDTQKQYNEGKQSITHFLAECEFEFEAANNGIYQLVFTSNDGIKAFARVTDYYPMLAFDLIQVWLSLSFNESESEQFWSHTISAKLYKWWQAKG